MLNNSKYKNSFSLILMIVISCVTQVFTVMKSSVVAGIFGLSAEMDAYNFANSIVSFVFGLVAGGIPAIIIPGYVNKVKREKVDSFITIIYGSLAVMIVLVIALRYQIVGLFSNREELFVNTACSVLLVLFFAQYLFSVVNITTSYFQSCNRYNIPKIINLFAQISVVAALLIIKDLTIYQYALIVSAGAVFNFIFDTVIAVKCGWRFKPSFRFKDPDVQRMVLVFYPTLFSSGVYQLSLFTDSAIASQLDVGKLTVLSYSNQIASIVNSVIIGNLLIYAYPRIIRRINENRPQQEFWDQVNLFHSIVCLVIAGFIAVGREGVSVLFEHGVFDSNAADLVYIGTAIYICGQQTNVIRDLIYRYFFANGDTKTTAINSVIVSAVNISVSLILVRVIGFFGIIIGTVAASVVSLAVILFRFNARFGIKARIRSLLKEYCLNLIICSLTIAAVLLTKSVLHFNNAAAILVFGFETVAVYSALTLMLNRKTLRTLRDENG